MIIEYTETWLNPLPYQKWFIIYNVEDSQILEDLSIQSQDGVVMNLPVGMKYVTFDSKEEGETYIEDNELITYDSINTYTEIDDEE